MQYNLHEMNAAEIHDYLTVLIEELRLYIRDGNEKMIKFIAAIEIGAGRISTGEFNSLIEDLRGEL
jgi:hypothetical protein